MGKTKHYACYKYSHIVEPNICVGDVVILKGEGTARCFWKMAKVINLMPGSDGKIRAAEVSVLNDDSKQGITKLRRPLQLLIPTEIRSNVREQVVNATEVKKSDTEVNPERPRRTAAIIGEILRKES